MVRDSSHDSTEEEPRANVRLSNTTLGVSNRVSLFTEGQSSSSASGAVEVFVPVASTDNQPYSYYLSASNGDYLVQVDSTGSVTNGAQLAFTVDVEVTGDNDRLVIAVEKEDGGDYEVVSVISTSATTGDSQTVTVDFAEICDEAVDLQCDQLDSTTVSANEQYDVTLAIFLTDDDTETTFATSEISNAAYYKINISDEYDDGSVTLDSLTRGEGQLEFNYTGFTLDNIEGVYATALEGGSCGAAASATFPTAGPGGSAVGFSNLNDLETVLTISSGKVKGLTNGTCYDVRVTLCDKFGFCSEMSNQLAGTPEEILALLTKNGCFFFTAGFGRDHYIIDYFKKFRDEVLKKNILGKAFVKFYYHVGPKYAPWLLDKPWAQKIVQIIAYILYGFLQYIQFLVIFMMSLIGIVIFKKSRKVMRGENRYGRS